MRKHLCYIYVNKFSKNSLDIETGPFTWYNLPHASEPVSVDGLLVDGGIAMTIRVIYKDKNVGRVNESRLEELIRSGRIAAFCRPDDVWVAVGCQSKKQGVD